MSNVYIHIDAYTELNIKYAIPYINVYKNKYEMVGKIRKDSIAVFSTLKSKDEPYSALAIIKHISHIGAFLLVLDDEAISTATIEISSLSYPKFIGVNDRLIMMQRNIATLGIYIDDGLIQCNGKIFSEYYWLYEQGKVQLMDACKALNTTKPTFYNMCSAYEKCLDFYICQSNKIPAILTKPKKNCIDYRDILTFFADYYDTGLTYRVLALFQDFLCLSYVDMWRTLLSFGKSRMLSDYLKEQPNMKKKKLFVDIKISIVHLLNHPEHFLDFDYIPLMRLNEDAMNMNFIDNLSAKLLFET